MENNVKPGSLVTIDAKNKQINTYKVKFLLDNGNLALLHHPLAPEVYLLEEINNLNNTLANLRSPLENCIRFCLKNSEYLNYDERLDLDAIALYYVVRRVLSNQQKASLAKITGKVASILNTYNISKCVEIVNKNLHLLDEFNKYWYNNLEKVFKDPEKVRSKNQKRSIYNISGFVMAQIGSTL